MALVRPGSGTAELVAEHDDIPIASASMMPTLDR